MPTWVPIGVDLGINLGVDLGVDLGINLGVDLGVDWYRLGEVDGCRYGWVGGYQLVPTWMSTGATLGINWCRLRCRLRSQHRY